MNQFSFWYKFRKIQEKWDLFLIKSKFRYKDLAGFALRHRIFFKKFALAMLVISISASLILMNFSVSQGATYVWNQASWAGGTSSDVAGHTSNRTGWTKYASKDSTVLADSLGISLAQKDSQTITDNGVAKGTLTALGTPTVASGSTPYDIAISADGTSAYVANYGSSTISMYSRNTSTGVLTALGTPTIATGINPEGITISPDGISVYAVNSSSSTISMYSRDTSTGVLTALATPTIATGSNPDAITISADGTSVYVANYSDGNVSMYSRDTSTGALTALSTPTVAAEVLPRGITISADGASVYVSNYASNTVSMYSRDTSTGVLTTLGTPTIATGTNPFGIAISADGTSVYVVNNAAGSGGNSTVSMYSRNISTGALTELATPTISIGTTSHSQSITVSPDGTSVYVANSYSGANSISMFSRNASTGALTALATPTIAAGSSPYYVVISADGNSVYATNNSGDNVSMYSRANGGSGFSAGTLSSTVISGSGTSATVGLDTTVIPATITIPFAYTGAIQTFTVPTGVTSITITGKGAGGGGTVMNAAGGSSTGTLSVTPGATYYILVGGTGSGSVGGYGGGGSGRSNDSGGGMTWFSTANSFAQGTVILVAGGGGGGMGSTEAAGAGGGTAGGDGINGGGGGGTQISGGAAGGDDSTAGSAGQGGNAATTAYGGGGGGGYYGGGGGGWYKGGGGGSGYIKNTLTNASTTAGTGAAKGTNGSLSISYTGYDVPYSGSVASYTVPAGAGLLTVTANGAGGGSSGANGGVGGISTGKLAVTSGSVYYISVGGTTSGTAGGYGGGGTANSGGGGGGMTWFSAASTFSTSSVLLVAGGGGGGGLFSGYAGGNGGGSSGNAATGAANGGGGTQSVGGSVGSGGSGGTNGSAGIGGSGASGGYCGAGAGGGGGYYGGGGGGGGTGSYQCGGGGGGSGYISSSLTSASTTQGGGAAANTNGSASIVAKGYLSSGTFTSGIIDVGSSSVFTTLSYIATLNSQTISMDVRAGNAATPDGTWTDWTTGIASGGSISALSGNRYIQYRANLSTTNASITPTLSSITINYFQYNTSGTLTSSSYNSESADNALAKIAWTENLPTNTDIKLQVRTASDNSGVPGTWSDWLGPDGTTSTYFTDPSGSESMPAVFTDGIDDQWIQYKVFLSTTNSSVTPTLSNANFTYAVNAPPEFDATYGTNGIIISQISDSADANYGKVKIQYSIKDIDTSTGSFTPNYVTPTFEYTLNGTDWADIHADDINFDTAPSGGNIIDFNSDGEIDNKVLEGSYLSYVVYWDAKTQIDGNYSDSFKVKTSIDDNESANHIATATSAATTLDTKIPTLGTHPILIDGSVSSDNITLSVSDDTDIQMKVGLSSDLSDVSGWEDYDIKKTITLIDEPETVYAQFRDAYGNISSIYSASAPEKITALMTQDTSNLISSPAEYRLFVAWKAINLPASGFNSYKIYRSTSSSGPWTDLQYTITDRNMNYYGDNDVTYDTKYYYKVKSVDSDGNVSVLSNVVSGKANGAQDAGEGGGGTSTTPPTISSVQVSSINTTQAIVTWDTDMLSNSTVGYSTTPGSFTHEIGIATMQDSEDGVGQHSVVLTGLSSSATYYFRVLSSDPSNNQGVDNNGGTGYSFTTLSGPIISNVTIPEIKGDEATITWETNSASDSYVVYSMNSDLSNSTEIGSSTSTTDHSITLSGLSLGTKYYFYVKSGISIDNNATNYYTLTTEDTTDTTPPTISDIDTSYVDNANAVITWKTNEAATSQIEYGTTSGNLNSTTVLNSNLNLDHSVVLVNLTADTRYYYRVISRDANNNERVSSENHFNTEVDPQYQHEALSEISDISDPPSIITDTKAVVTFNTDQAAKCAIEYGTESSNYSEVPFMEASYNINHSIHMTGLIFSTKYYYHIVCVDNLSNTQTSNEYSFTTAEKVGGEISGDVTAPDISSISTGNATGEKIEILWKTDEKASSSIKYGLVSGTYDNMAGNALVNSDKDNYVTDHTVTINNLTPGTKYYYKALSSDSSGNIGESSEQTFTTKSPSSLSSIRVVSNSIKEAVITWTTSAKMSSIVEYGLTEEYGEKKESSTKSTKHEISISGLESRTTYHFRVKGEDEDGNLYSSGDYTFQPKSPPKVSTMTLDSISEHSAKVTAITDMPTDILVTYHEKDNPENTGSQGKPDFVTNHNIELNNLKAGTIYVYTVRVVDEQGNQTTSEEKTFTTTKDTTPPAIDNVHTDSALTQSDKVQTIITWKTDEQSTSVIIYREGSTGEEKEFKSGDTFSTNHVIVFTSFKPGTVYNFKVKSTDASNNEAVSNYFSFLTPKQKQNIVQIIMNNFQDIFNWTGNISK